MSRHKDRAVTFLPSDIKIPKPPKQPDKPLPAYMRYSRKVWETVKTKHPEMKMWDIGKVIGEQWRNLPEDERQGFFAEYEVEKLEYQEAMKVYHNSNAYREWLKAKEKAQNAIQEQQMMEKTFGTSIPKEEPRFQLQQIDDEDDDEDFSAKAVAVQRYQRNHKLIAEIFSDTSVPNIKSIITRTRLESLKRQVQSLMQHQRKLESEIQEMEEKFSAKKRKILDSSVEFESKLAKFAEPLPPIEKTNNEKKESTSETSEKSPKTEKSPVTETSAETEKDIEDKSLCGQLRLTINAEKKQEALMKEAPAAEINENAVTANNVDASKVENETSSSVDSITEASDNAVAMETN